MLVCVCVRVYVCMYVLVTLLNRLPLESKGKNFVTFVCGIRLLNLEEKCPLREDLPLHFRENYLQEVKVPLPMEEFASNC